MTDSHPPEDDLLGFTPVATRRRRHDGWTPECQRRFIQALAQFGVVSRAARAVGKAYQSAYRLRERPDATTFVEAWDTALAMGRDRAYDLAITRGMEGYDTPRFYKGVQVGVIRRFDNRLLIAALAPVLPPPPRRAGKRE